MFRVETFPRERDVFLTAAGVVVFHLLHFTARLRLTLFFSAVPPLTLPIVSCLLDSFHHREFCVGYIVLLAPLVLKSISSSTFQTSWYTSVSSSDIDRSLPELIWWWNQTRIALGRSLPFSSGVQFTFLCQ